MRKRENRRGTKRGRVEIRRVKKRKVETRKDKEKQVTRRNREREGEIERDRKRQEEMGSDKNMKYFQFIARLIIKNRKLFNYINSSQYYPILFVILILPGLSKFLSDCSTPVAYAISDD